MLQDRWGLGFLAMIALAQGVSACFASRGPPLTAVQRQQLTQGPIDLAVAVVDRPRDDRPLPQYSSDHYAEFAARHSRGLAEALTGSFRSVALDSIGRSADLAVESTQEYCNTAVVPLFTLLTLGVIPTVYRDSSCTGMVFRKYGAERSGDSVVVQAGYTTREVMGWVAAPLLLWPRWTADMAQRRALHRNAIRLAVVAKRKELERLAGR